MSKLGILGAHKEGWFASEISIFIFWCDRCRVNFQWKGQHLDLWLYSWYFMLLLQFSFLFLCSLLMFPMKVHLWGKCTQWGHWVYSLASSYELNDFSIVLGVWINALDLHCCLKKQYCPPLSIWPHPPALGLERISLLPVWMKTSYFQSWFSVGSSDQSGTAPNPVMSSTHTKELMAMYGRKEADSDWFKLIIKPFNESC